MKNGSYGYVPNQRMFSAMSGLHSLQTNEEISVAAPCCVETTISHPGFHWDCIEIESWLIPMSTMVKSTLYLRKAIPIWPWNTLSKFCCPLSHSAELGVPTWKSEESAAGLSALAGAHGGTRPHQQVGCHSSHMSMRWPIMRLRRPSSEIDT
jgi:hypothetical protein